MPDINALSLQHTHVRTERPQKEPAHSAETPTITAARVQPTNELVKKQ